MSTKPEAVITRVVEHTSAGTVRASLPVATVMAYHTSQLRDYSAMMRAMPLVTPMSLSVYLQTSSLTLNDTRVGLSRWALPSRKPDELQEVGRGRLCLRKARADKRVGKERGM